MTFPTQFTVISSTTNATASGSANFAAIANKWSIQVVSSGQNSLPTFNFFTSTDGTDYSQVDPLNQTTNQFGDFFAFDTPAQYVQVTMGANAGTVAVYAVAQSD